MKESKELRLTAAVSHTGKAYQARVRVTPVRYDYWNGSIKYSCPVCESFGLKLQILKGSDQCPCCGVNLYWED